MTQPINLTADDQSTGNTEFFIPLTLTLDPDEKEYFIKNVLNVYREQYEGSGKGLTLVGYDDSMWPKTIAKASKLLDPIGLKARCITIFVSDSNITSWNVHKDGARNPNGSPTLLEARLAFYEVSDSPGTLRWWQDKDFPTTLIEYPETTNSPGRITCIADSAEDLRDNKLTWDHFAEPAYSANTIAPSAIVRTNLPHHVIQGNGFRVTIGCHVVFKNDRVSGVWEHLQKNAHLLSHRA